MDPLLLMGAFGACGAVGAGVVAVRSQATVQVVKDKTRLVVDRLVPLDAERGLDRIVDATLVAVTNQLRRGSQARAITVRLGPVIFATVAPRGDVAAVTAAVLGALGTMATPIAEGSVSVAVTLEAELDPTKVSVVVGARGASVTARPKRGGAPSPAPAPRRTAAPRIVAVLKPLTDGMPELEIEPGRERTIGRGVCDMVLPEPSGASHGTGRVHVMVRLDVAGRRVEVRDNASSNQTYVNNKPITTATMTNLDTLGLGDADWILHIGEVDR